MRKLAFLGVKEDKEANAGNGKGEGVVERVSQEGGEKDGRVNVWRVLTDEEEQCARMAVSASGSFGGRVRVRRQRVLMHRSRVVGTTEGRDEDLGGFSRPVDLVSEFCPGCDDFATRTLEQRDTVHVDPADLFRPLAKSGSRS